MDTESTFAALCFAVSQHSPVSVFCEQGKLNDNQLKIYEAAIKFVKAYEDEHPKHKGFCTKPPSDWSENKSKAFNHLQNVILARCSAKTICNLARDFARICDTEKAEAMAKASDRAWSPEKHCAYHKLLDAFIAREAPETVCEAAKALAKVCDDEFEGNTLPKGGQWYRDRYGDEHFILTVFRQLMDGTPVTPMIVMICPKTQETKWVGWEDFAKDFIRVDPPKGV